MHVVDSVGFVTGVGFGWFLPYLFVCPAAHNTEEWSQTSLESSSKEGSAAASKFQNNSIPTPRTLSLQSIRQNPQKISHSTPQQVTRIWAR